MKFLELGLPESLSAVLRKSGIDTPTPIQEKAIPLALQGKDLIASAKTGTGKTLAFSLPLLARLVTDPKASAMILVPTRELADQVLKVLRPFMAELKMGEPCLLIGGVSFGPQVAALRRGPRVIVATPGRLIDHLQNGQLKIGHVRALVLDEADRMLDMGFAPQVRAIAKHLPTTRHTMLFTATLPEALQAMLKELVKDPVKVFVDPPSTTNTDIEQRHQEVHGDQKNNLLLDSLNGINGSALIFCRTKRKADRVGSFLRDYGIKAEVIHGDRSQGQRTRAIDGFRKSTVKVLVATDIAARGIDIPQVELVINYDLPEVREDYVHRIGRTGRAGAKGVALSYVTPEERNHWDYLQGRRKDASPLPRAQKPGRPPRKGNTPKKRPDAPGGQPKRGEGRGPRPTQQGTPKALGGANTARPERFDNPKPRSDRPSRPGADRGEGRPARADGPRGGGAGGGKKPSGPRRAGWGHQASKKKRFDDTHWAAIANGHPI
jgi:superfamily II DNA/RNA helicase